MLNGLDLKGEGLLPAPCCLTGEFRSRFMSQPSFSTLFSQFPHMPPLWTHPTPPTLFRLCGCPAYTGSNSVSYAFLH